MFKFRNYDPETGTARKHARTDDDDTVEKQVEGLAEKAILQDEVQRAQELVSHSPDCTLANPDSPLSPLVLPAPPRSPHPPDCLNEQDLTNIQPKKPNWDLKRDLDRKVRRGKPLLLRLAQRFSSRGNMSLNTSTLLS